MMMAGLSGWVSRKAPGIHDGERSRGSVRIDGGMYLAAVDPAATQRFARFGRAGHRAAGDRHLDLLWRWSPRRWTTRADVGCDHRPPRRPRPPTARAVVRRDHRHALRHRPASPVTPTTTTTRATRCCTRCWPAHVGMPITLSVVAIEVGKRLDVPIVGVGLPGHFVVRDKQSGDVRRPVRSRRCATTRRDDRLVEAADGRRGSPFDRSMLRRRRSRDIVLRMLNNLKHSLLARDEPVLLARLSLAARARSPSCADEARRARVPGCDTSTDDRSRPSSAASGR